MTAELIADLVRAGVAPELVGRVAAALVEGARPIDMAAERRRAWDRDRKARANIPVESGRIPVEPVEGQPPSLVSPKSNTQTPSLPSPILASLGVLAREAAFDRLRMVYPKRAGTDPRKPAWAKFEAALKRGVDPEQLIESAAGYAGFVRNARTDPEKIKQLCNWIGQECWREDYGTKPLPNARGSPSASNGVASLLDRMENGPGYSETNFDGNPAGNKGMRTIEGSLVEPNSENARRPP